MHPTNILDVHDLILQQFQRDKDELPTIAQRIHDLDMILQQETPSSPSDRTLRVHQKVQTELCELRRRYHRIDTDEDLNFYLLQVTPMLEEYRQELLKPIELTFMGEPAVPDTHVADGIVEQFLRIAERTLPASYMTTLPSEPPVQGDHRCDHCKATIWDGTLLACTACGAERDNTNTTFSYNDTNRINLTAKYTYDRRLHFRDSINQFQGKQNSTIKQEVYDKLIEQFENHNLLRDKSLPWQVRFEQVTKQHIAMFLKEIGYAKHYEDINLIYHNLTGAKLDDISHLEEALMHDFDILSDLYNEEYIKTKKTDRKSFINTQYVLYQLLRRHRYPCDRADFNFLKTTERKGFHDEICSDLFAKLSWNFSPCF